MLGGAAGGTMSMSIRMHGKDVGHTNIEPQDGRRAGTGTRVTLEDIAGAHEAYELVAPGESDLLAGRLSTDSPVGSALLGRTAGETVAVTTPRGVRRLWIVAVAG